MVKIGIPRSLLYYQYFPMWKTFFELMGAEVVVSPPTTQAMVTAGSGRVIADTCLPVKVYLGHVLWLADRCDMMFIPAVRSVEKKVYNCSKFLGLPDMTRAVVPESPPILEIDIDVNKGKRELYRQIYRLGRRFSWNPLRVKKAAEAAWQSFLDYKRTMAGEGVSPPAILDKLAVDEPDGKKVLAPSDVPPVSTIAIIGHPYLIYDDFINHRLVRRLEQTGNRVLTPEMVSPEELRSAVDRVTGGSYWTYEEEVGGAGGHYLESGVDGVIGVMAFGCGPDSLMMDMVRRYAAALGSVPFMCLTIEEHTAEAGLITRIEAFTDMIRRKKRNRVAVCA